MPSPYSVFFRRLSIGASLLGVALTGCAGGGSSSSSSTTPTSGSTSVAPLAISTVSPTNVPVGSGDITLVVTGTGFSSSSVVVLNGVSEPTTFVSATELRAAVAAAQMKTGSILSISVSSGSASVKADPAVTALSVDNPVPSLASVSPGTVLLGTSDTTVTITGSNFVQGVALAVNGTTRSTTYVSDTQLTAQLSASDFTSAGSLPLNVINPKPGGGTSGTSGLAVNNPLPAITAVSPATVAAGSADTAVTLTGTGLLPSTVLYVNGASHSAVVVSGTRLNFTLASAEIAAAKTLQLTLGNSQPGGGTSAVSSFAVQNPVPAIASVSPSSLTVGSGASTLTLAGSGFVQGSTVLVNGGARTTQYISATSIGVTLNAADVASTGTLSLAVSSPQPGGGTSATTSVAVNNPVPTLASLTPSAIAKGSGDTTIALAGSGFLPTTTLQINGNAHAVTYVNSTVLSVTFPAAELVNSTSFAITATNPAPVGGTSSAVILTVGSGSPVITSLSPNSLPAGSAGGNVTITGTGFVPSSQVYFGGYQHSGVTYVSSTQLTLPLTASDLAYYGTYSVVISNPSTAGGVSPAATFTVQTKTPVITTVLPASLVVNSGPATLTVSGTNLQFNSTVLWNGTTLPTGYQYVYNYATGAYSYTLYATVSADLLATNGTASVTVTTPTAAAASNAISVSITDPPVPTISGVSPNAIATNTATKLTVSGAGYTKNSVLKYNGTPLTTTFVSSSSLTANIPANLTAFPGNGNVTVTTPAPGGGTSAASMLTVYVPVVSNSMVYNPVNGLAYLSIPSTGSTVSGNSIVSIDPATGALGTPIYVGSEPGVMAVSDDGKTLWVALNGTTAIRKVDLVNAVAGPQYSVSSLGTNYYNTLTAILVLPGTTDSVVVTNGSSVGIFDSGVLRGSTVSGSSVYALQSDGTRKEIYTGGSYLQAFTYGNTGLAAKSTSNNSYLSIASSTYDEMQLASGKMFTDLGKVYDPESAALLGTLTQGTSVLSGPTLYDTGLSQVYVLSNSSGYSYNGYNQVALFSPSDYSNMGKTIGWTIPYSITNAAGNYVYLNPHRLTRWGANGLMVHTSQAFFSMQSNTIKDQSSVAADLATAVVAQGGTTTGSRTSYTVTVKNNGPQTATDVSLTLQAPSTGILTSASASSGACSSVTGCTLGSIASGSSTTVTAQVLQTTSGTGTMTAIASSSSNDSDSSNNAGTATTTVTGQTYNLQPGITTISPASVKVGAQDITLTVNGVNFVSGSTVMLGSTALTTTFVSGAQLTATVPASNLGGLGWYPVTVNSPSPGGGSSGSLSFTVYNVLTVGLNHIIYEPYSRKLYASVSTGSSSVTAKSVVSVDPLTGTFGSPVTFTATPNQLALSNTGNTLYTDLAPTQNNSYYQTSFPFGRVNLVAGTGDSITAQVTSSYYYSGYSVGSLAVQPGTENSLALGWFNGNPAVYDYSASNKTLTQRGTAANNYNSSCLSFFDSGNLLAFTQYSAGAVNFPVSTSGLGPSTYLFSTSECVRITGSVGAGISGKIYRVSPSALAQVGTIVLPSTSGYNSSSGPLPAVALDPSLQTVFYPANSSSSSSSYTDGIVSYSLSNYLRTGAVNLNIPATEGTSYSYSINDVIRWGQDGLALVTSTGHLYLLRGPFVVPGELGTSTAATLSSSSSSTITRGSGNTLLTLTGTNFLPGVAVTWNGSYRTTTIVDATHVTVAVPSTDLASAGSASLVATNPGASASNTLTVTVQ